MSRAIKFISTFLGVAAAIYLLVFGLNRSAFETMFENREGLAEGSEWVPKTYSLKGLTEYIGEHPDLVSIASIVVDHPDSTIYFRENTPRAMGTLSNLFLLIAYADAFERGLLDRSMRLSWEKISRFQLPQIGESTHREALRYGKREGLIDSQGTLSLEDAVLLLSKQNSLALSDYLLIQLGKEPLRRVYREAALEQTDLPVPFSGLLLTLAPSLHEVDVDFILDFWSSASRETLEEEAWAHSRHFADGDKRDNWQEKLIKNRLGIDFMEERDLLSLFPRTTAREMTRVLIKIHDGGLISRAVSDQVLQWLAYRMDEAALKRNFHHYAAMYDNRIGLLNGIDIGVSAYTGNTTIQAVFFDRMHIAVWFHMSSNHMHQDFQQRLIWDPALIEAMKSVKVGSEESVGLRGPQ